MEEYNHRKSWSDEQLQNTLRLYEVYAAANLKNYKENIIQIYEIKKEQDRRNIT